MRRAGARDAHKPPPRGLEAVGAFGAFGALEADAARQGFSPRRVGYGRSIELVLDACPLADVAADDPMTVCAVHRGLAEGLVAGIGGARIEGFVVNEPYRAGCRVKVRRT